MDWHGSLTALKLTYFNGEVDTFGNSSNLNFTSHQNYTFRTDEYVTKLELGIRYEGIYGYLVLVQYLHFETSLGAEFSAEEFGNIAPYLSSRYTFDNNGIGFLSGVIVRADEGINALGWLLRPIPPELPLFSYEVWPAVIGSTNKTTVGSLTGDWFYMHRKDSFVQRIECWTGDDSYGIDSFMLLQLTYRNGEVDTVGSEASKNKRHKAHTFKAGEYLTKLAVGVRIYSDGSEGAIKALSFETSKGAKFEAIAPEPGSTKSSITMFDFDVGSSGSFLSGVVTRSVGVATTAQAASEFEARTRKLKRVPES